MTIVLTALSTLAVTILAGLALEYVRKPRARIDYIVRDAVPVDIEGKTMGVYWVGFVNNSKQTIKDVSCHVQAKPASLRNGGVLTSQGLQYGASEDEEGVQVSVPYLQPGDELQLTIIAESGAYVPRTPDVAIRTPQQQAAVVNVGRPLKRHRSRTALLLPASVAALMTTVVGFVMTLGGFPLSNQRDVLTFAAATANLPRLAEIYAVGDRIRYASQGDLVVALARATSDPVEREKYRRFLRMTLSSAPRMMSSSRAKLNYSLGQIDLLVGDLAEAERDFRRAFESSARIFRGCLEQDEEVRRFCQQLDLK